jgi:uncharacterized membrane protein YdjX (TVP38/TMEM64 family)
MAQPQQFDRIAVLRTPMLIAFVIVAGYFAWRWLSTIGGPIALANRLGSWAPIVSVPVHVLLSATPFPSELIGIANGSIYGLWIGTLCGWIGWWCGGMLQYTLARRAANDIDETTLVRRIPGWLRGFPAGHPAFMIIGRQLPFGFHAVNVMAAVSGVSPKRQMLLSAISNLIYAMLAAATGAGLVSTGWLQG